MLVGGSCDWTRHFGCEGAPNLLFQHTQWLERHEITIHPVRSANISPTQMIFRVKFIKHLLVPGLEVFLMFFCLISRCSTFLQPGFPTFLLAEFLPVTVSWWSNNLGGFFHPLPREFPMPDVPFVFSREGLKDIPGKPQHQDESPTHQCPRGFPHQWPFNQSGRLEVGPVLCQDFDGFLRLLPIYSAIYLQQNGTGNMLDPCWFI